MNGGEFGLKKVVGGPWGEGGGSVCLSVRMFVRGFRDPVPSESLSESPSQSSLLFFLFNFNETLRCGARSTHKKMFSLSSIPLMVFTLTLAQGQYIKWGKCPKISALQDFNMTAVGETTFLFHIMINRFKNILKVFILPKVAELFIHKEKQRGCPLLGFNYSLIYVYMKVYFT